MVFYSSNNNKYFNRKCHGGSVAVYRLQTGSLQSAVFSLQSSVLGYRIKINFISV